VRGVAERVAAVIRIDAMWLAVEPIDMRASADRLLARVVQVFGTAQVDHGVCVSAWHLESMGVARHYRVHDACGRGLDLLCCTGVLGLVWRSREGGAQRVRLRRRIFGTRFQRKRWVPLRGREAFASRPWVVDGRRRATWEG